jgi:hypothetical protein
MIEGCGRYRRCRKKKKGVKWAPKKGAKAPGDVFCVVVNKCKLFVFMMLVGVPPCMLVFFGAAVDVGMHFWREVRVRVVRRRRTV